MPTTVFDFPPKPEPCDVLRRLPGLHTYIHALLLGAGNESQSRNGNKKYLDVIF